MASAKFRWRVLKDLDEWVNLPMTALGVAWLAIVVWELVRGSSLLLEAIATTIWIIFIVEFAIRFALAPEKLAYLKSNWLTAFALAVPALRIFRAFAAVRAIRGVRGLRLVRIVGAANRSMKALQAALVRRGFVYVAGLTAFVTILGAAGMLNFEHARQVEGGFTSYGEALWWTGMLLASLGTDFWPVTAEGRLLTLLLTIYGLAVFGYITATLASFFIGRDAEQATAPIAGNRDVRRLLKEVEALRLQLAQGPQTAAERGSP